MQGISSTDNRSEVRNCAVRTLFAVVVSQGNRMSSELWDECLWEILFPLLRSVHHMSVTSSREEVMQLPLTAKNGTKNYRLPECIIIQN